MLVYNIFNENRFLISLSQLNSTINIEFEQTLNYMDINRTKIILNSSIVKMNFVLNELKSLSENDDGILSVNIPIYIAGNYNLYITLKNETIFKQKLAIPPVFGRTNYTTMLCHGEGFSDMWCEATNLCIRKEILIFISPYKLEFAEEVINPSAHGTPYNKKESTIGKGNIIVVNEKQNPNWSNATGLVVSRFYNNGMLWHHLMDFVVPAYRTLKAANATENCQIVMNDKEGKYGLYYAKPLCDNEILHTNTKVCYRKAIIGVKKNGEKNETKILLSYDIPHAEIKGLRERMLKSTNKSKCAVDPKKPKVVIIKRKQKDEDKRNLINVDAVVNETKKVCPFCNVIGIDLQTMNKLQQVEFICDVSLLIGMHGSGLAHALWMKESTKDEPTSIVEILPYMYTCRDWYRRLTMSAGVEYIPLYTKSINQSRWESWHDADKVRRCHSDKELCRKSCHDFLRDQSVIVDLKQYREAITPFIKRLEDIVNK